MKKVILVNASPRENGNCTKAMYQLKKQLAETCEVEVFNLRSKKVLPCVGCNYCKLAKAPKCVAQQDDMADLIPRLDACDAIVLASPIYFGMVNGPAKTFVDRLYCFFNPAKPGASIHTGPEKKVAVILTAGGGPEDVYAAHGEAIADGFHVVGLAEKKVICYNSSKGEDIFGVEEHKEAITELAQWIQA